MTAFSSIYTSLTGLAGFSDALNVISNNVANLNSPGFKASDVLFRDIGPLDAGGDGAGANFGLEGEVGQGVRYFGTSQNFSNGTLQSTGNPTDLAINGNGFFILKNSKGELLYTQNGQFSFDANGFLIDTATKDRVQQLKDGKLSDIQVDANSRTAPQATTKIALTGTLSTGESTYSLPNVNVIEPDGSSHTLTLKFTLASGSSGSPSPTNETTWTVTATDSSGNQVASGPISFDATGTPDLGASTLTINLPNSGGTQSIIVDFGTPGTFNGVSSLSAGTSGSSLQVSSNDGKAIGTLSSDSFDATGTIQLTYSNGDTAAGPQLALASFTNPSALIQVGATQFKLESHAAVDQPLYGVAGQNQFGSIQAGSIELANVDLSQQFSQIIILQQAFQGNSEVLNVSNQLLQQLYTDLNGGGGR